MRNNRSYTLSASLICADMLNIETELKRLEKGKADYIHFDVMDGVFVPRFGLPPETLAALRKITSIPVDVHLMVVDPEPYVDIFVQAGADIISFNIEPCMHAHRVVTKIKKLGARVGVAINPATNLNVLDYIIEDLDLIMVMAINPGIVGHKLIPSMIHKIEDLSAKLERLGKTSIIEVDGGVTFESSPEMLKAGANMLVCGSSTIFKPDVPVDEKLREMRDHLNKMGFVGQSR